MVQCLFHYHFMSPFVTLIYFFYQGTFGTVILQRPVEGGHKNGRMKVEYRGREEIFETDQGSDNSFYLSTYYNICTCSMEPVTSGWKLTLIFNLIWTNPKTFTPPKDMPVFLTSLDEIKRALIPWIPTKDGTIKRNLESSSHQQIITPSPDVPVLEKAFHEESCDSSESDGPDSDGYERSVYQSWKSGYRCLKEISKTTSEENVLFFVLREKYEETDLTFSRLRGKDQELAHLIQSCPFLDAHLAAVTLKEAKQGGFGRCRDKYGHCDYCADSDQEPVISHSAKISRWIDSNDVIKNFEIKLNLKKDCVGPSRNFLTFRGTKPDSSERDYMTCGGGIVSSYFYHSLLVIWPRHQSIRMHCKYNIHSLLDRMEYLLNSAAQKEEARQKATCDLKKIIKIFCDEPQILGTMPTKKKGELAARLLRLCTVLRSRDGLVLLKKLGPNFGGIQNEQVAKEIADFECKVTGNYFFSRFPIENIDSNFVPYIY